MTDWENYVAYSCRNPYCQENCINPVDSAPAHTKQCRDCYDEGDLDDLAPRTHHLPKSERGPTPTV
jgi:hypothetical protein